MSGYLAKSDREKYCSECAALINAKAEICPRCGVRQAQFLMNVSRSDRSRLAAALLAILFGGFGLHKFYLGQPLTGIIYLLFCWTFLPAIIGFIEGLGFLVMSDNAFFVRYG